MFIWTERSFYSQQGVGPYTDELATLASTSPSPMICSQSICRATLQMWLVSHRPGRTAASLSCKPIVLTFWEAKNLIYGSLFSFSTQPYLDSVTHRWSALTSTQILFGVLLFKKITGLTLETDLIS